MKTAKRCLAFVVTFGLVFAILKVLPYWIVDDTELYTRVMMHEFYEQDDIDVLMVGASHCYIGVDPDIMRKNLGKNVFLASSANQYPDISLAIIKEALDCYDVEHVYFEMSPSIAMETGMFRDRAGALNRVYQVTDYMEHFKNKFELLLKASSSSYYLNTFLLPHGDIDILFDPQALVELHRKKETDAYKNYEYDYLTHEGEEAYSGLGHVRRSMSVEESAFFDSKAFYSYDFSLISDDWKDTLLEVIDLCERRNVQLTLFCTPLSDYLLAGTGNYDEYRAVIQGLIAGRDVEYVDFNLIDSAYFSHESRYYSDADHLNQIGAEVFSKVFSDYINGSLPEDAFWGSVSERLEAEEPMFAGITFEPNEAVVRERPFRIVTNHPGAFEYRFTYQTLKGKTKLLRDFSTDVEISISFQWGNKLIVEYKPTGAPDETAVVKEYVF